MKRILIFTFLFLMTFVAALHAELAKSVPMLLNFQSVMFDEGGNPLPDGPTNIYFRFYDNNHNILYAEKQSLEIISGVVTAMVGNGLNVDSDSPTGGMPIEIFDPTSPKYLEAQAEGYPPETLMEVVSSPYAIWSQTALNVASGAIGSDQIADGAIESRHLSEELLQAVFPNGLPKSLMPGDVIYSQELIDYSKKMADSSGAKSVGVANNFKYSGAINLQGVLNDFDTAIFKRQQEVDKAVTDLEVKRISTDDINLNIDGSQSMTGTLKIGLSIKDEGIDEKINDSGLKVWGEVKSYTKISAPEISGTTLTGSLSDTSGNHSGTWQGRNPPEGVFVGDSDVQTLTNKAIAGGSITADVAADDRVKVDGVDISALDEKFEVLNERVGIAPHVVAAGYIKVQQVAGDNCAIIEDQDHSYNVSNVIYEPVEIDYNDIDPALNVISRKVFRVTFIKNMKDANYIAIATGNDSFTEGHKMFANVIEKQKTYMRVQMKEESDDNWHCGNFSFVVYEL